MRNYRSASSSFPLHCIFCCTKVTSHIVGMFLHTSLSNGSPSKRNWSASLSELPTAMKCPFLTSFSLGLSTLLLQSASSLGPIVCTCQLSCSSESRLSCSLPGPFSSSDRLSLMLLLTVQQGFLVRCLCLCPNFFSTFPFEFKGSFGKRELCPKRRFKDNKNKTQQIQCGQFFKSHNARFFSRITHAIHRIPLFR